MYASVFPCLECTAVGERKRTQCIVRFTSPQHRQVLCLLPCLSLCVGRLLPAIFLSWRRPQARMVRALLFVVRRLPQHAVKEQEETTHVLLQVRGEEQIMVR